MEITYSKQASKYLAKLHRPKREQLQAAINKLPEGDTEKVRGSKTYYRMKIHDYRVIYSANGDIIHISKIGSSGDIYNGL